LVEALGQQLSPHYCAQAAALGALPQALDCAGSPDGDADPRLSAAQLQQRRTARQRLCEVVGQVAVPLLEAMVGQEFTVWKAPLPAWLAQNGGGGGGGVGTVAPVGVAAVDPAAPVEESLEIRGYDKVRSAMLLQGVAVSGWGLLVMFYE
jgi:hypothetical protein